MTKMYLIEFDGFIKIGITGNLEKRLKHIVSLCQQKPRNYTTFSMEENPLFVESAIKTTLSSLGFGFAKSVHGLPKTEIFKSNYKDTLSLIKNQFNASEVSVDIDFTIESIDGTRKAGRKPKSFKSVNRRVPEPLLEKFEKWRNEETAKLQGA